MYWLMLTTMQSNCILFNIEPFVIRQEKQHLQYIMEQTGKIRDGYARDEIHIFDSFGFDFIARSSISTLRMLV